MISTDMLSKSGTISKATVQRKQELALSEEALRELDLNAELKRTVEQLAITVQGVTDQV